MRSSHKILLLIPATILFYYLLIVSFSCVREEQKDNKKFLFSIDGKEYDLANVLFDYKRMTIASDTTRNTSSTEVKMIKQRFLIRYINEELLYYEAKRRGIEIDRSIIDVEIQEMKEGHTDMTFGTYLSSLMLTEAVLREKIERRLVIEALINSLVNDKDISEEKIIEYYNSHKDEFRQETMCRMKQIVVKTREEAQNILTRLKKGDSFEELAQQYSESPEKKNGGDLGFLPINSIDESFRRECNRLREEEVSGIIESTEGYRIYKMVGLRPAREFPLDDVREKVRIRLLDEYKENEKNNLLRRLRMEHKIFINEQLLDEMD